MIGIDLGWVPIHLGEWAFVDSSYDTWDGARFVIDEDAHPEEWVIRHLVFVDGKVKDDTEVMATVA